MQTSILNLPPIATDPPEPLPSSLAPVSPDADQMRRALYDARREIFRARQATVGNAWLGGLAVTIPPGQGTHVTVAPGVASLVLPIGAWTDQPSGTKLLAPHPPTSTPSNADGALRVELPSAITLTVGVHLPTSGDRILLLGYDETAAARASITAVAVSSSLTMPTAIPLALVTTAGGAVVRVRDMRPPPPWRPRMVQVATADSRPFSFQTGSTSFALVPGLDLGAFWLDAAHGVYLTADVRWTWPPGPIPVATGVAIGISRAVATDLTQPHWWFTSDDTGADAPPPHHEPYTGIGQLAATAGATHLHLETVLTPGEHIGINADSTPYELTIPGLYDVNGVWVLNNRLQGTGFTWASLAATVIPLRRSYIGPATPPVPPNWLL